MKQKRKEADYMSTARRDLTEKLHPASLDTAKTLKQRTEDFNKLMLPSITSFIRRVGIE